MRSPRERHVDETSVRSSGKHRPLLIVSNQTHEAIRRRREIREAFHDSKALIVKARRK